MQQAIYYPHNHKTTSYTPITRYQVQTLPVYHSNYTPISHQTHYEINRTQLRPLSHNVYTGTGQSKQFPPYLPNETKHSHELEYPLKNTKMPYEKTFAKTSEIFHTGYGEMKHSCIPADAREVTHNKNTSFDQIKLSKASQFQKPTQSYTYKKWDRNIIQNKNQNLQQQQQLDKKNNNNYDNNNNSIENYKYGLTYTASMNKFYPKQKIKMRKSSYDIADNWLKSNAKKKNQKKFVMNDFKKICDLGIGKYGKVYLVKQKSTQFICALKIIQKQMVKDQQLIEQFIRQLKIQMFLNHPNIIKMYGFFEDTKNIYIILQVALGGQLYKHLHRGVPMSESKVANIMRQVVSAINELHSYQIIHRDIKPQNVVLNENVLKVCDFGWSVYHGQALRTTFCGTPLYVSPQVLKGLNYDQKIDIWSLGIMMYEMLVGENPFKITQEEQLIKIIKNSVYFPSYINISNEARDFVLCCLKKNPEDRANIRQLSNHQFFKRYLEKEKKVTP